VSDSVYRSPDREGMRKALPGDGCRALKGALAPGVRHPMGLDVKLLLVGGAASRRWPRRRGCAF